MKTGENREASLKGQAQVAMIRLTIIIEPLVHRACITQLGVTKRTMENGKESRLPYPKCHQIKHSGNLVNLGEAIGRRSFLRKKVKREGSLLGK